MPKRNFSKSDTEQGLFKKFVVLRTDSSDSPGGRHCGCEYFVIDINHDPCAKPALLAYAEAVRLTHPVLAEDMISRYQLSGLTPANLEYLNKHSEQYGLNKPAEIPE